MELNFGWTWIWLTKVISGAGGTGRRQTMPDDVIGTPRQLQTFIDRSKVVRCCSTKSKVSKKVSYKGSWRKFMKDICSHWHTRANCKYFRRNFYLTWWNLMKSDGRKHIELSPIAYFATPNCNTVIEKKMISVKERSSCQVHLITSHFQWKRRREWLVSTY